MVKGITTQDMSRIMAVVCDRIIESKDYLCELDGAIGDGDHGIAMAKAFQAIKNWLNETDASTKEPSELLQGMGMVIISNIGGAMGPLFGGAFLRASSAVKGIPTLSLAHAADILVAAEEAVSERGKVSPGDKTMLDSLHCAAKELTAAVDEGVTPSEAGRRLVNATKKGMESTKDMVAKRGRSSRLGERTLGHQDAGATSVYIIIKSIVEELQRI